MRVIFRKSFERDLKKLKGNAASQPRVFKLTHDAQGQGIVVPTSPFRLDKVGIDW